MKMYVFAGPNGSGKSTLIAGFYEKDENKNIEYICPDDIARAIDPEGVLDENVRYIKAMEIAEKRRYELLAEGKTFCFETVLSTPEKIDFIQKAKEVGYKIIIIYTTTKDPAINVKRVAKRVSEKGHDVPSDKIYSRYFKSAKLIPDLINLADEIYMYDNSYLKPQRVYLWNKEFMDKAECNKEYVDDAKYKEYLVPLIVS